MLTVKDGFQLAIGWFIGKALVNAAFAVVEPTLNRLSDKCLARAEELNPVMYAKVQRTFPKIVKRNHGKHKPQPQDIVIKGFGAE